MQRRYTRGEDEAQLGRRASDVVRGCGTYRGGLIIICVMKRMRSVAKRWIRRLMEVEMRLSGLSRYSGWGIAQAAPERPRQGL